MKKLLLSGILSIGLYLGTIYLYKRGHYWLVGVGMACFGILGLTERWKKTHDVGYVLLLILISLGFVLSVVWLIPQGIVGPFWMFLLLASGIVVVINQRAKN